VFKSDAISGEVDGVGGAYEEEPLSAVSVQPIAVPDGAAV
jgi:hypothetical protein